jgi:uncharacterized short protein YbdD (DUF466 family)
MNEKLSRLKQCINQAAHLLVGMPDYDNYVARMQATQPDEPVMTYDQFFRERQEARYGARNGRSARCC